MIRKQIYLKETQQAAIRDMADARSISEAEVIREAIDAHRRPQPHNRLTDPSAWNSALKLMRSLQPKKSIRKSKSAVKFDRAELYEGRLNRYGRRTR
jgi:hypothetical protein